MQPVSKRRRSSGGGLSALALLLALLMPSSGCSSPEDPEVVPFEVESVVVDGRELFIYLPPGYDSTTSRYPVLYMNDGEALFGLHGWRLERRLDELIRSGRIGPMIVVGIASSAFRTDEYVPYYDQWIVDEWGPYVPRAPVFAQFVVERVVPFVDSAYRTVADRTARGFIGASFGGLLSLWAVVQYDSVFSMGGGLSPSLWVDDYRYIREMGSVPRKDLTIWFDMGTREWNYYVPLIDTLSSKGYRYGTDVVYYEHDGGEHSVRSWMERIDYPLILFNGPPAVSIKDHRMVIEVIPRSSSPGYYMRLNPVVEMDNGLCFSLSSAATYTSLDTAAGSVGKDGSFSLLGNDTLVVRVAYTSLVDTVRITPDEVEYLKTRW